MRSHSHCATTLAAPINCAAALVPRTGCRDWSAQSTRARKSGAVPHGQCVDTLGIEPRASRMLSGCDTATPCALRRRCCARFVLQARVGPRRPLSKPTRRQTALHTRQHTRWRSQGPHRLVVRTSLCGRDNPGWAPGVDIFAHFFVCCRCCWRRLPSRLHASRLHAIQASGHLHQLAQMQKDSDTIMPCHMGT